MLKNFMLVAYRAIMRSKTYSLINILGLSTGLACCLLLALYIHNEYAYDRQHKDLSQLYHVITTFHGDTGAGLDKLGTSSPPIVPVMTEEVPEIMFGVRLVNPLQTNKCLVRFEDKMFYEENLVITDSTFFDFFTYNILEGNGHKALVKPNSVAISDELARKLFGDVPALNKTIEIAMGDEPADYNITAVFEKNNNSHLAVNLLVSITSSGGFAEYVRSENAMNSWAGQNFLTAYFKLRPGTDPSVVDGKMNQILNKYGAEQMKAAGFTKTLSLEPVSNIYLKSVLDRTPRIKMLYILGSIALFVLLIACINFMNLATAKALKRAGEIGVRKVMGALRGSLIRQILGEAMIIVFIAVIVSLVMIQLALPWFNELTEKSISITGENAGFLFGALAGITLLTGLVSGIYPAFYLSSFQPAQVLKAKLTMGGSSGILRKTLVVLQFVITILLVCGLIVISRQLHFIQNKDLGFETANRLIIPLRTKSAKTAFKPLKSEIAQLSMVKGVAGMDFVPGTFIWNDALLYKEGSSMEKAVYHPLDKVNADFIRVMNLKLLAGRDFVEDEPEDDNLNIIVNRASIDIYGFTPEEAIGKRLFMDWQGQTFQFTIVGVIDNYNQFSLRDPVKPLGLVPPGGYSSGSYENMLISVNGQQPDRAIDAIEALWKKQVNDTPFEYTFLDQDLAKQYLDDRRLSKVITVFSAIAMFISCLGLYGLSSYMAERRFKEIGIRKVMGANVPQIVRLMSMEFVKLVILATLIAVPLGWYMMAKWLTNFAFRISLNALPFIYAGLAALLIALFTVSFESIRAAQTNPVKSLRSE